MAESKWIAATSRGNVLTTELNSLAHAARTNRGTTVANQTNLDTLGVLELQVTFGSAPTGSPYVAVYMLTAPDGTNFGDGSSTVAPGEHRWILNLPVRLVTTAQRIVSRPFELDPFATGFILLNQTNVAFPASGSTVALYTANYQSV